MRVTLRNFPGAVASTVRKRREIDALRARCVRERALALTYDDGPFEGVTDRVLDVLREHDARATFFMIGSRVERWPSLASRVAREGHEVASHTFEHLHAWRVPRERAREDILRGESALQRIEGMNRSGLHRPPYGKTTPALREDMDRAGLAVCWWTIDSGDTRTPVGSPGEVADRLGREGGGVVLMHDFAPDSPGKAARVEFVLDATAALIERARRDGLRVVTMGEVLGAADGKGAACSS